MMLLLRVCSVCSCSVMCCPPAEVPTSVVATVIRLTLILEVNTPSTAPRVVNTLSDVTLPNTLLPSSFVKGAVVEEPPHTYQGEHSLERGDILVYEFGGQTCMFDLSVGSPFRVNMAGATSDTAANSTETRKVNESKQKNEEVGLKFIPFGMSPLGGYGDTAIKTMAKAAEEADINSLYGPGFDSHMAWRGLNLRIKMGTALILQKTRESCVPRRCCGVKLSCHFQPPTYVPVLPV